MANNKAFVRYANNKAVPGSLIVRKKAPSVGTWKEVTYDLCCDSGGNTTRLTSVAFTVESGIFQLVFSTPALLVHQFNSNYSGSTAEEWLEYFNGYYSWMGTFLLNPEDPTEVFFDINTEILNTLSGGGELLYFSIGPA
jgi:hypothetical protein